MLERWDGDPNLMTIVTDKDSKVGKVTKASGMNVEHQLDTNHAVKAFARKWDDLGAEKKGFLRGLKDRLMRWLKSVLHLEEKPKKKLEMWQNTPNHYSGDHRGCKNPDHQGYQWKETGNPAAQEALREIISAGSDVIRQCDPKKGSTQGNESFHGTKAKFADTMLNYSSSTEARFGLAVIAHSDPSNWENNLRAEVHVAPIPHDLQEQLRKENERRQASSDERKSPQFRKKRNAKRTAKRANDKNETRGKDDCGKGD